MEKPNHGIDYEGTWDAYAEMWQELHPELDRIGDEWIGKGAGAASTLAEYETLIEQRFIQPISGRNMGFRNRCGGWQNRRIVA